MGRFKTVVLGYLSLRSIQRGQVFDNKTTKNQNMNKTRTKNPTSSNQRDDRRRIRHVQFNLQANQVYVVDANTTTTVSQRPTSIDPTDLWYSPTEFKAIRDQILLNIETFVAQDMPRGALGIKALRNLYKECQGVVIERNQNSKEHHNTQLQKPQDSVSTSATTTKEQTLDPLTMIATRSVLKRYVYGDEDYKMTILGLERVILGRERLEAMKKERRNTLLRCQQGVGIGGGEHKQQQQQQGWQKLPQKQLDLAITQPEWWRGSFHRKRNKIDSSYLKHLEPTPQEKQKQHQQQQELGVVPFHHSVSAASHAASQFAHELAQQLSASLWEKA